MCVRVKWSLNSLFCRLCAWQPRAAPKASKAYSEPRARRRERASSVSSLSSDCGSEVSVSTALSAVSSENKRRRHHKERRKGRKVKDYTRKRGILFGLCRYDYDYVVMTGTNAV